MQRIILAGLFCAATLAAGEADFNGRWLIEPQQDKPGRVAWLEVQGAGTGSIRGHAVGLQSGGQMDPLDDPRVEDGELRFRVERMVGGGAKRHLQRAMTSARLVDGELRGETQIDERRIEWVGRRAPVIEDRDDGSWKEGQPVVLFGGDTLDAWTTLDPANKGDWGILEGALVNSRGADLLVSKQAFWNFRLELEFLLRANSNSGVGLRGRYEVQLYDDHGQPPSIKGNGAVYSRLAPTTNASLPADKWQTMTITLIGRDLTVVLNGETIHDKVELEGLTAMATDWRESEPGPITLQGDHGLVEFRKIVLTPLLQP